MKIEPEATAGSLSGNQVRLVLIVEKLNIEAKNLAPDYLKLTDDQPEITFIVKSTKDDDRILFKNTYPLIVNEQDDTDAGRLGLQDRSLWFDFKTEQIDDIWMSVFDFRIESHYPKYLKYSIQQMNYSVQLLQNNAAGDMETLSISKREYQSPVDEDDPGYSLHDAETGAGLLGRAVKKIDFRTGTSFVRLTTEQRYLEPLMQKIATEMGYELSRIDERTLSSGKKREQLPTHIVTLKRNY